LNAPDPATRSVRFDQAVDYYDRTRALPPDAAAAVTELLVTELGDRAPVLDAGVGTGRIARPVAERGVPLAGIDISLPMLEKLVENAGGVSPFELVNADVTSLPFPNAAFGGALASHLLHLVPDWQQAVAEMARVVRAHGIVLLDLGESGGDMGEIHGQFSAAAGLGAGQGRVGLKYGEEPLLDEAMAARGASTRVLSPIEVRRSMPPGAVIDLLEQGRFSATWQLEEPARRRAADETREWARDRFGSLDEAHTFVTSIEWRAYDLP
jgi:SAM-dependent methyltransferase